MLDVTLTGEGSIDNAVIYLEDPKEKIPYFLNPTSGDGKKWERKDLNIPIDGLLDYALYVVAFSGTGFTCIITNKENDKEIEFSGITGRKIKSQAYETGSEEI